ncbi:hypothetical protein ACFL1I_01065 [Candidatus Omnitrophota bacterium]
MKVKKIKLTKLSLGLTLAAIVIVLAVGLIIKAALSVNQDQKQRVISEPSRPKEQAVLQPGSKLPQIEEFDQDEYLTEQFIGEQEQVELSEMRLEDLPLSTVVTKPGVQVKDQAQAEPELSTQPSQEELAEIQRKGLIIF